MSNKINPDIDKLLNDSGYDDATKDLVRQLITLEIAYANRSNYDATQDILKLIDSVTDREDL